jgi:hypothetical protein
MMVEGQILSNEEGNSSEPQRRKEMIILNKQQILELISTLEHMRRSGFDAKDKRFQTLVRILKSQDLNQFIKKQDNDSFQKNDTMVVKEDTKENISSLSPLNDQHHAEDGKIYPMVKKEASLSPFTPEQIIQFKAQMYAYKLLVRNEDIPQNLLLAIQSTNQRALQANRNLNSQPNNQNCIFFFFFVYISKYHLISMINAFIYISYF